MSIGTAPVLQPVRLGLVGLGMAGGIMASAAAQHPDIEIVSGCDLNPDLRERFAQGSGATAYADLKALLGDDRVEAVYIATPHQFHRQHAVLALEAGKHVVVEKPMALSLEDCDAMIATADRHGRALIVGHTHSFDPAIERMSELLADERIGPVAMLVMLTYTNFLYRPRRPEELDTSRGGGIVFNQIPHQVDVARFLIDAPVTSVRAVTAILDSDRPTEGAATCLLQFANGACATLTYSGYDRFDSDEFHNWINEVGYQGGPAHGATRRALEEMGGPEAEMRTRSERYGYGSPLFDGIAPHQPHFGSMIVTCRNADMRQSADGVLVYDRAGIREYPVAKTPWRAGFGDVLSELVATVRLGKPARHDGRFARETVEVCHAVLQSAAERREVILGA
jgi:phthalate 4,5-cis-dihydrodiol dehydrogenase